MRRIYALFLGIAFCALLPMAARPSETLSDWSYRRRIDIESLYTTQTQQVCVITLDTYSEISAFRMNPEGSDIRFTRLNPETNQEEPVPHYLASGINTYATDIWILAEGLLPSPEDNVFFLYYGNPDAPSQSDREPFEYLALSFDEAPTSFETIEAISSFLGERIDEEQSEMFLDADVKQGESGKSLCLFDKSEEKSIRLKILLDQLFEEKFQHREISSYHFSADYFFDQNDISHFCFRVAGSDDRITAFGNGMWMYWRSKDRIEHLQLQKGYLAHTWYRLDAKVNLNTNTMSVWIDGDLVGENLSFEIPNRSDPRTIAVAINPTRKSREGKVWIDNIVILPYKNDERILIEIHELEQENEPL